MGLGWEMNKRFVPCVPHVRRSCVVEHLPVYAVGVGGSSVFPSPNQSSPLLPQAFFFWQISGH